MAQSRKRQRRHTSSKDEPGQDPACSRSTFVPAEHELDEIAVPREFLHQVALILRSEKESGPWCAARDGTRGHLLTLKRQAKYVQHQTTMIQDWLANNRVAFLKRCSSETAGPAQYDEQVSFHEHQALSLVQVLERIEEQVLSQDKQLDEFVGKFGAMQELVTNKLLALLKLPELPTLLGQEAHEVEDVIQLPTLQMCEQDCDKFLAHYKCLSPSPMAKYPRHKTADSSMQRSRVERIRQTYDQAVSRLNELQDACDAAGQETMVELRAQRERVETAKGELRDAVEGARFAGIPTRSNGSFAVEVIRASKEMTHLELEEQISGSREKTHQWLSNTELFLGFGPAGMKADVSDARNMRKANDILSEVNVEDGISVVGESDVSMTDMDASS